MNSTAFHVAFPNRCALYMIQIDDPTAFKSNAIMKDGTYPHVLA
jgi:hypothetical protein